MDLVMTGSILSASLLGSVHCAGMCGGLVAFYAGRGSSRPGLSGDGVLLHTAYNLGRLSIYITLGALAGLLGAGLNLAGGVVRWQNLAALLGGAWMLGWGLQSLAKQAGVIHGLPNPLTKLSPRLMPLFRRLHGNRGVGSAYALGLLTGFLPCGWLYLFVGGAAGSGSASSGALMMAVFWLGTVPAMASLGLLLQKLSAPVRRYLPTVAAMLLVVAGLYTLGSKLGGQAGALPSFHQGLGGLDDPSAHSCGQMP